MKRFALRDDAQSVTEFALLLAPILLIIVCGLVELAFLMSDGGTLGCAGGQSPNAANVDPNVIAAVERILTGTGTRVTLSSVNEIRIFKATSTGAETTGLVNVWTYDLNNGPVVDGQPLDFEQQSQPWQPCARSNLTPPDSIGVTVRYTYRARTPLGFLVPYFNQITIVERSVMAENVSR